MDEFEQLQILQAKVAALEARLLQGSDEVPEMPQLCSKASAEDPLVTDDPWKGKVPASSRPGRAYPA